MFKKYYYLSLVEIVYQLIAYSCWSEDAHVSEEGTDVFRRSVVNQDIGLICFMLVIKVILKQCYDIILLKREPLEKLETLSKHIKRLIVSFSAKSNSECSYFIDDSSVFKHSFRPYKNAINLADAQAD